MSAELTWLMVDQCCNRSDTHCCEAEFFPPCLFSFLACISKDLVKCFLLKRKKVRVKICRISAKVISQLFWRYFGFTTLYWKTASYIWETGFRNCVYEKIANVYSFWFRESLRPKSHSKRLKEKNTKKNIKEWKEKKIDIPLNFDIVSLGESLAARRYTLERARFFLTLFFFYKCRHLKVTNTCKAI